MVINIKNPDIPATKKQLWLLHLLTGTDTRNSNLTMQQASDKISELKGNKSTNIKHKPINEKLAINPLDKLDKKYHGLIGQGLNIGGIFMVQAFKEIRESGNKISIDVKASGIFPNGKKPHTISDCFYNPERNTVCLQPLFAHIRSEVTITIPEYTAWIKSLPAKVYKYSKLSDDMRLKGMELSEKCDRFYNLFDI